MTDYERGLEVEESVLKNNLLSAIKNTYNPIGPPDPPKFVPQALDKLKAFYISQAKSSSRPPRQGGDGGKSS